MRSDHLSKHIKTHANKRTATVSSSETQDQSTWNHIAVTYRRFMFQQMHLGSTECTEKYGVETTATRNSRAFYDGN